MDERNAAADVLNQYWDNLVEGNSDSAIPRPDATTRAFLREFRANESHHVPGEAFVRNLRNRLLAESSAQQRQIPARRDVTTGISRSSRRRFGVNLRIATLAAVAVVAVLIGFTATFFAAYDRPDSPAKYVSLESTAEPTVPQNNAGDSEAVIGSLDSGSFDLVASAPAPGHAWHSVVEVEVGPMYQYQFSRWTTETWQRTLPNGTVELAVEASDETGHVFARYVRSGDQWQIEQGEIVQSGVGEPEHLPTELMPYRPMSRTDLDQLVSRFPNAEVHEQLKNGRQVVELRFDAAAEEAKDFEQLFGAPLSHRVWAYIFGVDGDLVREQRSSSIDTEGTVHLQRRSQLVSWEQLPSTELEDSRFAFQETPDTPPTAPQFNVPSPNQLPLSLHISTHDTNLPMGGERLIFVGDGSLVVELRVIPNGFVISDFEGYKESQTTFGSIRWKANDGSGAPVRAFWSADSYSYSVFAYNRPIWTEENLIAFAETLVNAQRTR